ncbi:MAG: dTDP-4-dehydrorhamnose reductase [Candidatus Aureabacteria bacterium]|nr:dTDP-4-dehydrorhamnose reductase [Candidatus Auribacterota bacterium]
MAADKKLLVIGSAGMLGRDLMDVLPGRWQVMGADIHEVDITDPGRTELFIADRKPSAVINAAARTDVDGCESDLEGAFAVNAHGAGNIARACGSIGARMVHVSTDYVFDGLARKPYREGDPPNPQGVYGKSKRLGEEEVAKTLQEHIIVRTSWLFGMHGRNFVDTILRAASRTKRLEVVGDQRGSPTYSRDLAEAIARLLLTNYRGIVHVVNSGSCSWYEYALAILDSAEIPDVKVEEITSDRLSRPAPRPPFSLLDCSLYEKITGARMRPWRDAVGEYIKERGKAAVSVGSVHR